MNLAEFGEIRVDSDSVEMRRRSLQTLIDDLCFADGKIALLSGPRQCGKTTLARRMLKERGAGKYFNWDQTEFRRLWTKQPSAAVDVRSAPGRVPLVVLDEIHKARAWKRTLKGLYDTLERRVDLLVTGSARLAVYRRGSDSLLGRYRSFRLHPFSVGELADPTVRAPDETLSALREGSVKSTKTARARLDDLLRYGPFPEPLLAQDERKARLWRRERTDAVIRQDLRDLSRITELDSVMTLAALLPERVGSPLSVQALREDLEVSHETVRRWLTALGELYFAYEVKPHSKRVARAVRKEGKLYLWDWGDVVEPGRRFENLVAGHLLKSCHMWTDAGYGDFDLRYLRNRDGKEIDFLITRDDSPWLPVEVKLADTSPSRAFRTFLPRLRCDLALQIVRDAGAPSRIDSMDATIVVAPAADILRLLN